MCAEISQRDPMSPVKRDPSLKNIIIRQQDLNALFMAHEDKLSQTIRLEEINRSNKAVSTIHVFLLILFIGSRIVNSLFSFIDFKSGKIRYGI